MIEKIKDVLNRNYSTLQIEARILERTNYDVLLFKMHSGFDYNSLISMFRYWGVDWKYHVRYWSVDCNNNITVQVRIFILKTVECNNDEHDFLLRNDWGKNTLICNKCGLFKKTLLGEKRD